MIGSNKSMMEKYDTSRVLIGHPLNKKEGKYENLEKC